MHSKCRKIQYLEAMKLCEYSRCEQKGNLKDSCSCIYLQQSRHRRLLWQHNKHILMTFDTHFKDFSFEKCGRQEYLPSGVGGDSTHRKHLEESLSPDKGSVNTSYHSDSDSDWNSDMTQRFLPACRRAHYFTSLQTPGINSHFHLRHVSLLI